MRRWTDALFALTVLLALSGHGDAAAVDAQAELDEDHSLKSQLVTPHTPWGKGYAKGKVSALFVVNSGHYSEKYLEPGTKLREVVELMQRFDVDGEAIFVGPKGEFYKGKDGEARGRRLLEKEYDVYVFAGAPFEAFSPELQYKMLERVVQKGAGLVCSGPKPKNILTPKRVLSPIPGFLFDGVPVAELALRRGIIAEKDKLTDDK
ncbi:MAG: hypothetical protein FJ272_13395, partial [Planctomycetes bacterium]|nr:hypothetical protein [Planctomycetota bacterium]